MSIVFTQFNDGLPVDENKEYYINGLTLESDSGLQEIHKYCLFPSKLSLELRNKLSLASNIKTHHGYTPLMIAVINDVNESVKLLLQSSALININIQNEYGETALILTDNIEITKLLLEYGADVNIQDERGITALILACLNNDIKCIKLLLEYGANINIQDNYNETAFSYLNLNRYNNNIKCIKLLLQYEDNINTNYIIDTVYIILSNINQSERLKKIKNIYQIDINIRRLKKFDYNSILLYELKKCVF